MGRTKHGNANAQRNNNAKKQNEISEELVEFHTDKKNLNTKKTNKK
ncbi:hypothetical protein J6TS2_29720 [Heyndrickxia sporothermodurans]|nr:hypothetical protein J6TS2_29720 [Heyndrickxia sporothermodurans]